MPGIVDLMEFVLIAAATSLFLGSLAYLAALIRLLAPMGGTDHMPTPPNGVLERAADVSARMRAHLRNHPPAPPREVVRLAPEPMQLRLILGRHTPIQHQTAA
jgi:hypothetical protein